MKQRQFLLLLLLIFILNNWKILAQIPFTPPIIDTTQIRFCNTSPTLANRGNNNNPLLKTLPPSIPAGSFIICGNGKFRLIFRDIINATGSGFDDATLGATRRNCVCDVINYIESIISIPSNIGTTDPTIDIIFNVSTNTTTGPLASAAPVYTASVYNGTAPAGYYGGFLYDYITTGVKPDVNSEEAQVNVNFGYPYSYCTPTIGDCHYDFYSTILHEITHALGFLSFAQDNSGVLSSSIASRVFSIYDQFYLFYNNGTTLEKLFSVSTFSLTNGVNPALPINAGASDAIWTSTLAITNKQNQPIYSSWPYATGTSLSHLESSYQRCCSSPGYSPNYVMTGTMSKHQLKREYTLQEVSMLQTMGYTINSSYTGFSNINNHTPYHSGNLITAFIGGSTGYMNTTPASGLADLTISTTNGNPVTLNLSTGVVTNGSTSQNLNFIDADSDPITVYEPHPGWKGLYNLRGCGNGNNSNQLNINVSRDIITFTPRNNFIGRAQFAFHLYDGKQRGDFIVFTIDVSRGNSFVNSPSNELIINGNFEEGTEVRELGANEFNTVVDEIDIKPNYLINAPAADGVQIMSYGWNDVFIRNSSKPCLFLGNCFDNCSGTAGSGLLPVSNIGDRWMHFSSGSLTERFSMTLAEPILPCSYQLEADLYVTSAPSASSTVSFHFHNQGINSYAVNVVTPILTDVTYSLTTANVGSWTHITLPFTYTSSTSAPFFEVDAPNYFGGVMIDNVSLVRTGISPALTFNPTAPVLCTGLTSTLSVSGASTYTWNTGTNTNSIVVSPTVTTSYSVIGTSAGGCMRSGVITLSVAPTPTLTVNSVTICSGSVASLSVTGASSYTWSTGTTGSVLNITPTVTTVYTVTGRNALANCSSTNTVSVFVNPAPNGTLTPNGSISLCGSQTITLNAISDVDPNTSYGWTYNGTVAGSGHNINVSLAGNYQVVITNTITNCSRTFSTPVYVAPTYVCDQCLVPNGDFEYYAALTNDLGNITDAPFWNSPTGGSPDYYNTASSGTIVTIPNNVFATSTPDHTGNVTQGYLGFINYAGSSSDVREYAQTPLNCALEPNQKYNVSFWTRAANDCQYNTKNVGIHFSNTQITGSGALYTYSPQVNFNTVIPSTSWSQLTGTITGSSANFITIGNFYNDAAATPTLVNSGAAYAIAYYFIDDVSVTPAPPSFTASASSCITSGSAVTLTLSGSPGYYVTNGITTQTLNSATGTVAVSPTVTTTYTITPKLNCVKCNIFSVVTISVTPVVSVSNATICSGQTTTLTASGATTYSWNTGATTSSISVSPTSTTNYTITGTSSGCSNTKTVTVTVKQTPTVTAVASTTAICVSQSVTLTAGGASTYTWLPGLQTTTVITVTPSVNTTYTVTGTNSVGCTATKTVNVIVYSNTPTVTVNSSFVSICGTSAATMIASGANNYTWTPGPVYSPTSIVTPTAVTVYTVRGNNGASCGASTKTIIVSPTSSLCCSTTTNVVGTSLTSSVNMASGTYAVAGTVIDMQGVITFTGNTSFNGYTFRMKAGTLLRVVGEYTLSLINCKLFSCSELWDGISLPAFNNDIHGHVSLDNTTVEDMYNGIVVEGNAWPVVTPTTGILISTKNSKLNKNYIAMQFRNIDGMFNTATMSFTTTPYPFSMITTTISSYASTTSPAATLKPSTTYTYAYNTWAGGATSSTNTPFVSFPRTYTGIALNNMRALSPLIIGDSVTTGNTNTFDNMDFGIRGTEVTAKVHNNYFKNITGSKKQTANGESYPAFGPDEIGIAVAMTHTSTNVHVLTVGTHTVLPSSNPYPKGNKFEDCNRGIYAISCKNVYAKANTFTATATSTVPVYGVDAYYYYKNQSAIWVNALTDDQTLSFNYIRNFSSGIYSSHTFSTSSRRINVSKNDISAPSATGFCKQAIQIAQIGGVNANSADCKIEDNAIVKVYNGILAGGVPNCIFIKNNSVSVEPKTKLLGTTSTAINTAIRVSNSNYAMVQANSVSNGGAVPTTPTTANYITGIWVSGSTNVKVECNNAYHLGRGFVFGGSCSNSSWKVNSMSDSYRGLEMQLVAIIGAQGAAAGTPNLSANTWTTLTQETYVLGTNPNSTSRLFLNSNIPSFPKTEPTLNFGTNAYGTLAGGLVISTGTLYTCNAGNAQRMANGSNDNNTTNGGNNQKTAGASSDSLTELTNLATADEDSYEVFADEMMYQNQQFVYELIEQDSINPAKNSTLSAFYNSNNNTAIGKLTEAQIAIANFDISAASAANSSAPVLSAIEQKQQRANELVLKYMNDRNYVFTDAEKMELKNMANECVVKGDYVTHARNLVEVFTPATILYDDDCEAEANASRKKKPEGIVNNNTLFNLFPNPNNGTMQLDYKLGSYSNAKFSLFDITGKLLQSINIETNEGSLNINEQNLRNGVYFYTILVGEKNIKTDKIVIIK